MLILSSTSMIKVQYSSNGVTLYTESLQTLKNDKTPFLLFVYFNDWLQNHCWLLFTSLTPNFLVIVNVLLPI